MLIVSSINSSRFNFLVVLFLALMLPGLPLFLAAQDLYLMPGNREINSFLDELAGQQVISLNTAIKPYSRKIVAQCLTEAQQKSEKLTPRQVKELEFYLRDYATEVVFLKEEGTKDKEVESEPKGPFSLSMIGLKFTVPGNEKITQKGYRHVPVFTATLKPLVTFDYGINQNGSYTQTEIGAGLFGYIRNHFGYAVAIRKGFQSEELSGRNMTTEAPGHRMDYFSDGSCSYVEWTGQLTYSWKWGSIGLMKDRISWGDQVHGPIIFSEKPPSFIHLRLDIRPARWIDFTYLHGWLTSNVPDSGGALITTSDYHGKMVPKYLAANMVTIRPWRYLNISLGNSVVYSDKIQIAYLLPILFFKSIDHTLYPLETSSGLVGDNAQMFLNISSRQIRHLHLFLAVFVDELMVSRISDPELHNFLSWKGGFSLSNFPLKDLILSAEFTRTLPLTYQHPVETTTFENDGYNFGNYLLDNAQEIFLSLNYHTIRRATFSASFTYAEKGIEYIYGKTENGAATPFMKSVIWSKVLVSCGALYEIAPNMTCRLEYEYGKRTGDVKFNPLIFHGKTSTISFGISVGL